MVEWLSTGGTQLFDDLHKYLIGTKIFPRVTELRGIIMVVLEIGLSVIFRAGMATIVNSCSSMFLPIVKISLSLSVIPRKNNNIAQNGGP